MTRISLLLTLAGATGAAALGPKTPATTPAPLPTAATTALTTAEKAQAANVSWMGRYGFYNAKNGAWELVPQPGAKGC